jgi:hypothetical protein
VLAIRLLCHLNNRTGRCNPSNPTLAREMGVSVRYVRGLMHELAEMGITRGEGGNFKFDRSRLRGAEPDGEPRAEPENETETVPADVTPEPTEQSAQSSGQLVVLHPHRDGDGVESAWLNIQNAFPPSKHGHDWDAARVEYDGIVASGVDHQYLLAQVLRYAAARHNEDPKYTPRVAKWFADGSWKKEYPDPIEHLSPLDKSIVDGLKKTRGYQRLQEEKRRNTHE